MRVLNYNSNGFPLYWIDSEKDSPTFLKLFKRIDKNTSQIVTPPKYLQERVYRVRVELLNTEQIN